MVYFILLCVCECFSHGGQKSASLELETQTVVSHHLGARKPNPGSLQAISPVQVKSVFPRDAEAGELQIPSPSALWSEWGQGQPWQLSETPISKFKKSKRGRGCSSVAVSSLSRRRPWVLCPVLHLTEVPPSLSRLLPSFCPPHPRQSRPWQS